MPISSCSRGNMMPERIGILNEEGTRQFRQFVESVHTGAVLATPLVLLRDPATSSDILPEMMMEEVPLTSRLDLGRNLVEWLQPSEQREVSWNTGLWNWLQSETFCNRLCPAGCFWQAESLADLALRSGHCFFLSEILSSPCPVCVARLRNSWCASSYPALPVGK